MSPGAPVKIGRKERMKEPYSEDLASHAGPESCICTGNGMYKALSVERSSFYKFEIIRS